MGVVPGQVVYSKAGRDKDRVFVIIEVRDNSCVVVVDGKLRKFDKRKIKKIKHLRLTNDIIGSIKEKLENNIEIKDAEVRKALAGYKRQGAIG